MDKTYAIYDDKFVKNTILYVPSNGGDNTKYWLFKDKELTTKISKEELKHLFFNSEILIGVVATGGAKPGSVSSYNKVIQFKDNGANSELLAYIAGAYVSRYSKEYEHVQVG